MNLALSNFAWDIIDTDNIIKSLNENNIKSVELILTKFKNWDEITESNLLEYRDTFLNSGIKPYAIQSLFYNVNCNLDTPELFVNHLKKIINYSEILDIKILVFGSPNLRKKVNDYEKKLVDVFSEIDSYLNNKNINLLIEPNTASYGGEYFFNLNEIIGFIDKNKLINIKTMIDTHNIILENGDPIIEFETNFNYIYHIHISEPKLKTLSNFEFHNNFSKLLKNKKYDKVITYEVLKTNDVLDSLKKFSEIYF